MQGMSCFGTSQHQSENCCRQPVLYVCRNDVALCKFTMATAARGHQTTHGSKEQHASPGPGTLAMACHKQVHQGSQHNSCMAMSAGPTVNKEHCTPRHPSPSIRNPADTTMWRIMLSCLRTAYPAYPSMPHKVLKTACSQTPTMYKPAQAHPTCPAEQGGCKQHRSASRAGLAYVLAAAAQVPCRNKEERCMPCSLLPAPAAAPAGTCCTHRGAAEWRAAPAHQHATNTPRVQQTGHGAFWAVSCGQRKRRRPLLASQQPAQSAAAKPALRCLHHTTTHPAPAKCSQGGVQRWMRPLMRLPCLAAAPAVL